MLIYEKNNKLNINFENELDNPDIEIGKGEINVGGNNIVNGGSGGGVYYIHGTRDDKYSTVDKNSLEIKDAYDNGAFPVFVVNDIRNDPAGRLIFCSITGFVTDHGQLCAQFGDYTIFEDGTVDIR